MIHWYTLLCSRLLYQNKYARGNTHDDFVQWITKLSSDTVCYDQGMALSGQLITQFEKNHIRTKLISLYRDLVEKARSIRAKRVTVTLGRS